MHDRLATCAHSRHTAWARSFVSTQPAARWRHKPRVRHLQRREDVARAVFIQRLAGNPLDQRAQHDEIDIAVGKPRPRRVLERRRERHSVSRFLACPRRLQIQVRRQARIMGKQLPHGDVFFSALRKFRQIFRYRIIQPHLALFDQLHHSRSSRNHLGQRCQIKNCIQRHRLAARLQRPASVSLAIDHLTVVTYQQDGPGNLPFMNRLLDDSIHRAEMDGSRGTLGIHGGPRREDQVIANGEGNHCDHAPARQASLNEKEGCFDSTQARRHDSRNSSKGVPLMPYHGISMRKYFPAGAAA